MSVGPADFSGVPGIADLAFRVVASGQSLDMLEVNTWINDLIRNHFEVFEHNQHRPKVMNSPSKSELHMGPGYVFFVGPARPTHPGWNTRVIIHTLAGIVYHGWRYGMRSGDIDVWQMRRTIPERLVGYIWIGTKAEWDRVGKRR